MREMWDSSEAGCLLTSEECLYQTDTLLPYTLKKTLFPYQKLVSLNHFLVLFYFKNCIFPYKRKLEN